MTGDSILAAALGVSFVSVTETSIKIIFNKDVVDAVNSSDANWTKSAGNLDNYSFQIGGSNYPLTRYAPYSHFTDYYNTTTAMMKQDLKFTEILLIQTGKM